MRLAQRSFVYGVMVGVLCCLAGPADAQQDPPAADPAGWMIEDRLDARLQIQLHRVIWPGLDRGV